MPGKSGMPTVPRPSIPCASVMGFFELRLMALNVIAMLDQAGNVEFV
jgi:hypothetical protein